MFLFHDLEQDPFQVQLNYLIYTLLEITLSEKLNALSESINTVEPVIDDTSES